jgi:hypothetical protein
MIAVSPIDAHAVVDERPSPIGAGMDLDAGKEAAEVGRSGGATERPGGGGVRRPVDLPRLEAGIARITSSADRAAGSRCRATLISSEIERRRLTEVSLVT